jgi:hypothetical protein
LCNWNRELRHSLSSRENLFERRRFPNRLLPGTCRWREHWFHVWGLPPPVPHAAPAFLQGQMKGRGFACALALRCHNSERVAVAGVGLVREVIEVGSSHAAPAPLIRSCLPQGAGAPSVILVPMSKQPNRHARQEALGAIGQVRPATCRLMSASSRQRRLATLQITPAAARRLTFDFLNAAQKLQDSTKHF